MKNHVAQCSCPTNFLGNPLVSCTQAATKCNGICECDEIGYCTKTCNAETDCVCGESCVDGKCRNKCNSQASCAQGQVCTNGVCLAGCRSSNDCSNEEICQNKKCYNPCKAPNACGENAVCRSTNHRKVCLCSDGYQGDPLIKCAQYECQKDDDCEASKKCDSNGSCRNPCQEQGACGSNAQCRVIDRKPHCTCPPGYIGNALIECKKSGIEECLRNPCGENAKCKDLKDGSHDCTCPAGCVGDPYKKCTCDAQLVKLCKDKLCGTGAKCKVINDREPQCYCPSDKPVGDPTIECKDSV